MTAERADSRMHPSTIGEAAGWLQSVSHSHSISACKMRESAPPGLDKRRRPRTVTAKAASWERFRHAQRRLDRAGHCSSVRCRAYEALRRLSLGAPCGGTADTLALRDPHPRSTTATERPQQAHARSPSDRVVGCQRANCANRRRQILVGAIRRRRASGGGWGRAQQVHSHSSRVLSLSESVRHLAAAAAACVGASGKSSSRPQPGAEWLCVRAFVHLYITSAAHAVHSTIGTRCARPWSLARGRFLVLG